MNKFEKVKRNYDEGLWSITRVRNAVLKDWITPSQFEEITGIDYYEYED